MNVATPEGGEIRQHMLGDEQQPHQQIGVLNQQHLGPVRVIAKPQLLTTRGFKGASTFSYDFGNQYYARIQNERLCG